VAGRVLRVALTGGIATGKSYCLKRFAALGAETIDADVLARQAVESGTPGLAAVVARFGRDVLKADGTLDRAALARIVFADDGARRDLEAIVHPYVFEARDAWLSSLTARAATTGESIVAIADIPLLFEAGRPTDFDLVIVVACDPAQQRARVMTRDHLTASEADRRIAVQWPINRKRALADIVIDTSGDFEETDRQIDEAWKRLATKP
jgi:dephospho-CoA kinase